MRIRLKEVFGVEEPQYMMGIAYETVSYDDDKNSKVKHRGWEVPYQAADPYDIDAYASKYQIPARRSDDARSTWESDEPFQDSMTGEETYYTLYVKNMDGSDVSKEFFDEVNDIIGTEDEEAQGMKVTPRPLVL